MINILFRIFAAALLLIIVLAQDTKIPKFLKIPLIQLYLAMCVIFVLLLIDNMTGFILGLCLLIAYFKIYNMELQNKNKNKTGTSATSTATTSTSTSTSNSNHVKNVQRCPLDNYNYKEKFSQIKTPETTQKNNTTYDDKHSTQIEYTTPEHLLAAQNNIYDLQNYHKEILGVDYGPQGLNSMNVHYKGNENSLTELGSLHFAILENE